MVVWNGVTADKEFVKQKMGVKGKGWMKEQPDVQAQGQFPPPPPPPPPAQPEKEVGWPAVLVVGLEVEGVGMPKTPELRSRTPGIGTSAHPHPPTDGGRRTPMIRREDPDGSEITTEEDEHTR